jgi:methionyl-tRNA formyltransferase
MLLDEELDHGPIIAQARVEIEAADWPLKGSTLESLLADEGGSLLAEAIGPWVAGEIQPEVQDHDRATFTKKFDDSDARLDLAGDAYSNLLKIRAFDTNPRAYMVLEKNGKPMRVIVTDARLENEALVITSVIPEGKKEMAYDDFMRGFRS